MFDAREVAVSKTALARRIAAVTDEATMAAATRSGRRAATAAGDDSVQVAHAGRGGMSSRKKALIATGVAVPVVGGALIATRRSNGVDKALNAGQLAGHFSNKIAGTTIRRGGMLKPKRVKGTGALMLDSRSSAVAGRMVRPSGTAPKGMVETLPGRRAGGANRAIASQGYRANLESIARTAPAKLEGLKARGQLERWHQGALRAERKRVGTEPRRVALRPKRDIWS
jgi:hypothetical protein